MHKIGLIILREYLTRVRKKSFIIMTILGPLIFGGIVIMPVWLASQETSNQKIIAVVDESGIFAGSFDNHGDDNIIYEYVKEPVDHVKREISNGYRYGLLYIPDIELHDPKNITFFSEGSPSIATVAGIRQKIQNIVRDIKLSQISISKSTLEQLETNIQINTVNLQEDGSEQAGNANAASIVGYIAAFLIYGFIFLYGAQVMRGVIEEKSNRIVEIIISSVKPFQLMMGKIIGVASVGLTQFVLWVILSMSIAMLALQLIGPNFDPQQASAMASQIPEEQAAQAEAVSQLQVALDSINIPLILTCFLFYFLGGYLLYGALFAAIGSAADSDTDTQQFMLPIAGPLIFSIVTLASVLNEPNGNMAFWLSMIPFTSPVTMMMRVPFGVPVWQLALSMVLLVGGFILTTWIAGRIYRIGILTHGTKINYKTIGKWLFNSH